METKKTEFTPMPQKVLTPALTIFVSFACLASWLILVKITPIFAVLFKGLEVSLPFPTKFLIASYSWLYPLLFGGAAVAVIVQEFLVRDARRRLITTAVVFVGSAASVGMAIICLYLPLFLLTWKLGRM